MISREVPTSVATSVERTLAARKAGPGCRHNYPIAAMVVEGGRRARCLGCWSVGPVREGYEAARMVLLSARPS